MIIDFSLFFWREFEDCFTNKIIPGLSKVLFNCSIAAYIQILMIFIKNGDLLSIDENPLELRLLSAYIFE